VLEAGRPDRTQHIRLDPYLHDKRLAAKLPSRIKQMARLLAEEGHRNVGSEGRARNLSDAAADARWKIDRDGRNAGLSAFLDRRPGVVLDRLGQAGAEKRV